MRLLVAGDTHGNTRWVRDYLYPWAVDLHCDGIVQVGDFGFWEHEPAGVQFLDEVSRLAGATGVPLFWLRGNHDNIGLLRERYGAMEHRVEFGFWRVREGVMYIPDGCVFEWQGLRFRAFGGAYSVDKQWRLDLERKPGRGAGTLWFPGEELTDEEMDGLLAQKVGSIDVILSHDKPRASPSMGLKKFLECLPNQDRLQRAMDLHRPSLWLHGHLHRPVDQILWQGTRVIGLDCDDHAAGPGWRRTDSFCVLDWTPDWSSTERPGQPQVTVIPGAQAIAMLRVADEVRDEAA